MKMVKRWVSVHYLHITLQFTFETCNSDNTRSCDGTTVMKKKHWLLILSKNIWLKKQILLSLYTRLNSGGHRFFLVIFKSLTTLCKQNTVFWVALFSLIFENMTPDLRWRVYYSFDVMQSHMILKFYTETCAINLGAV